MKKMTKIGAARMSHEAMMKDAAREFIAWGQKYGVPVHLFAAGFRSKQPIWETNGSRDAVSPSCQNPEHKDCPRDPLTFWDKKDKNYIGVNPCLRLDYSGLTAIDIDSGLGGKTLDEMAAILKTAGLPPTQMIKTGRRSGGFTLLYRGVRDADHTDGPFEFGPLKRDVKCHGHIVIPGGLHLAREFDNSSEEVKERETRVYRKINDWRSYRHPTIAPLPDYWMNWKRKKEEIRHGPSKQQLEFRMQLEKDIAAGQKSVIPAGGRIPRGKRFAYLKTMAGRARLFLHLGPEALRNYLEELAILECEGGREYADEDALKIDFLAGLSENWNRGDFITEGQLVIDDRVSKLRVRGAQRLLGML